MTQPTATRTSAAEPTATQPVGKQPVCKQPVAETWADPDSAGASPTTSPPATQPAAGPHRRADAQRNHERILAVARLAVAERGGDVVLEDIARDAGVGIGTLYRHFPTRQALFEATFLDEAVELRAHAVELARGSSPLEALSEWLHLQMDFGAHGRAMGAAVMNAKHVEGSEIQVACTAMRDAGEVLLQRAQEAGQVRSEVILVDVLRLIQGVVLANEQLPDPDRAERMFDLVIAGIRS